jgi:hypothetical protein
MVSKAPDVGADTVADHANGSSFAPSVLQQLKDKMRCLGIFIDGRSAEKFIGFAFFAAANRSAFSLCCGNDFDLLGHVDLPGFEDYANRMQNWPHS